MAEDFEPGAAEYPYNSITQIALVFKTNILLVLGAAAWWGCHYSLLWNPYIANAYALLDGFDVRFIVTLAGTVFAFGVLFFITKRFPTWQVSSYRFSYGLYALCTLASFCLMAIPLFFDIGHWVGLLGAMVSGIGNSVGMLIYGELHARVEYRFEPLMFAAELIGGIVLFLICSVFSVLITLVSAALLSILAALLFYRFSKQDTEPVDLPPQTYVDMTSGQLTTLALLMGFTYGLMRTFSTGDTQTYLGLDSECLGSCLCAFLLIGVFISQKKLTLFEQCLLFVLPLVATGMLLVTIPGANTLVPTAINTIGFACFFNLIWYFAPVLASKEPNHTTTYLLTLLFLVCQFGQLLGSLVPVQVSGLFSSGLMYILLLALILFMLWYVRKSRQDNTREVEIQKSQEIYDDQITPVDLSYEETQEAPGSVWERELGFSQREADVAMLLIQRIPYKQISQELMVSENTVKTHARNIYKKADVASREELIELYANLTKKV
ncbi:MAG: helix-turn-helix transcriptional regulator [Coriobacteriales bacterium]|nr:helix-turn-helix transcriptional regulator [Coriobacteriales bacterium]